MHFPEPLTRFREMFSTHLANRAATLLALLDTFCTNQPSPVVPFPVFPQGHHSLYRAVAECHLSEPAWQSLPAILLPTLLHPGRLGVGSVDVTGHLRPYARTLGDRQRTYQPTPIAGHRPVSLGHRYSLVFAPPPRRTDEAALGPSAGPQARDQRPRPEVEGAKQVLVLLKEGFAQGWLQPQDHGHPGRQQVQQARRGAGLGQGASSGAEHPLLRRHRVFYRRLEPPPLAPDKQVRVATEEGQGFWEMAMWYPRVA